MKRFYIAAVAGLCALGPARGQDGALAPTAPMVPQPVLKNGGLPNHGTGLFSRTAWSPLRSPVVAGDTGYATPATAYAVPPLPAGVGTAVTPASGACGPAGCGHARGGVSWDRLKAWLCYTPSKTELPKCQPTPYVTPLQGMFSCTSGSGCATGCATGRAAGGYAPTPLPPAMTPPPPMMAPPNSAGAVVMPPRGAQGAAAPSAWQGRTTPAPTDTGYRFAQPDNKAAQKPGPVVNAGYRPAPK